MRDWLFATKRMYGAEAVVVAFAIFGFGFAVGCFVGTAAAAPLKVHVRQANLYRGTLAQVRLYGTIKGPGTATVMLEPIDTSRPIWQWLDPTVIHVQLHAGRNRIHRTVSVAGTERTYCGFRQEFAADHPECPYLPAFKRPYEPYLSVPHGFDRVRVEVSR